MANHLKKKAKTSQKKKEKYSAHPLGSEAALARLLDEESKDNEERKLESMLFGVPYVPSGNTGRAAESGEDEQDDGGRPMAGLLDSDVSCCSA